MSEVVRGWLHAFTKIAFLLKLFFSLLNTKLYKPLAISAIGELLVNIHSKSATASATSPCSQQTVHGSSVDLRL